MITQANIRLENLAYFYDEDYITDDERSQLLKMAENGQDQEALDIFVSEYMMKPSRKYQDITSRYLGYSDIGPLDNKDENKLLRNISLLSVGLIAVLLSNFKSYTRSIYAVTTFKEIGLQSPDVKKAVLDAVLTEYEQLINGAMAQTQTFIMNGIRTLQREMIAENVMLKNAKISGAMLDAEVSRFKNALWIRYPDIYNAMNNGNVLVSRKFGPDGETIRHYKFDYYTDMATRTTLLNVNRNATEIVARVNGERVVGYAQIDHRPVKKDRIICQEILHMHVLGVSLLALDNEAASILGIMTVDNARNTPDHAMSVNCRHGLIRLPKKFLEQVNKLLEKAA